MIDADLIVTGASEVRTCAPGIGDGPTGRIERGALAALDGRIVWVGKEDDLSKEVRLGNDGREHQADGKAVVPGFVDAHTHLVFAGSRREEFSARASGKPYSPRGILDTVSATRAASRDELLHLAMARADLMLAHGTTTAEAKSGYALEIDGELTLLEVLAEVHSLHAIDLEITFLGAHALPDDFEGRADDFVDLVCDMVPVVASAARWCDVFCDVGAFSPEQSWRILEAGKSVGLAPRIHANELASSGGASVAAAVGAASADHLIHADASEARSLAKAGTVGVLCPITALGIGKFPDASMMRQAGMTLALSCDLNPGTSYSENIQLAIAIATRSMRFSAEEALLAVTSAPAVSLRREDVGRLVPGCLADVVVLQGDSALDLGYHAGVNLASLVIKRGVPVGG